MIAELKASSKGCLLFLLSRINFWEHSINALALLVK